MGLFGDYVVNDAGFWSFATQSEPQQVMNQTFLLKKVKIVQKKKKKLRSWNFDKLDPRK